MTTSDPRAFPALLAQLHALEFDYDDGEGMDFEPYKAFMSEDDTQHWIGAWTGNDQASARDYLIFGQDGTGGYAAFWNIEPGKPLLEQPIVFFGSEGELGVIALNFADYLWLLAGGFGPYEAVSYPDDERPANEQFTAFAQEHAAGAQRSASEILAAAQARYPDFEERIRALCK